MPAIGRIYISSKLRHAERWRILRDKGVPIMSTWIDGQELTDPQELRDHWNKIESEIRRCDTFVLFLEPDDFPARAPTAEAGMALAFGKTVILCTPDSDPAPELLEPLIGSWVYHRKIIIDPGLIEDYEDLHLSEPQA